MQQLQSDPAPHSTLVHCCSLPGGVQGVWKLHGGLISWAASFTVPSVLLH